ncbi:transposase [Alkalihalobacillus sp. BA299]|uniref:transposase n=1 Tax=Alkalihalobacillus sp. BA299 TaxID=2815938 RepID=UPI001FFE134D|nr:transposase [Alkalihalobacillus sp. BA299]
MLRGANRQEIFHDEEDSIKFMDTIVKYKIKTGMKVYGWCLMGNHVHLLVKEGEEDISNTMKRIGISYAYYYNWKYFTTGHLFQDRFKSENVETDRYLLTVIRYIHQNPVKAGIIDRPDEWKWSSCLEYYGQNNYPVGLLDIDFILKRFSDDLTVAKVRFKEFNERKNKDACLEETGNDKRKVTDEEARVEIRKLLDGIEIAQVKSLPKQRRNEILQNVKKINGVSQRQAARILGVSPNLIFKA